MEVTRTRMRYQLNGEANRRGTTLLAPAGARRGKAHRKRRVRASTDQSRPLDPSSLSRRGGKLFGRAYRSRANRVRRVYLSKVSTVPEQGKHGGVSCQPSPLTLLSFEHNDEGLGCENRAEELTEAILRLFAQRLEQWTSQSMRPAQGGEGVAGTKRRVQGLGTCSNTSKYPSVRKQTWHEKGERGQILRPELSTSKSRRRAQLGKVQCSHACARRSGSSPRARSGRRTPSRVPRPSHRHPKRYCMSAASAAAAA